MRFAWLTAAAAIVCAGQAEAETVTQTFFSTSTQVGSTGPVPIGRIGLRPDQIIRSAIISYEAASSASIDFTAYAGAADSAVISYFGSAGFGILGLPVPVSASNNFSGSNACSGGSFPTEGRCSATYSFAGSMAIPEADLALFANANPLQIGSTGSIDYTITYNGGPAPLMQRFTSSSVRGSIVYDVGSVPEPASWAMMIFGVGAIGGVMRRRSKIATKVRFA